MFSNFNVFLLKPWIGQIITIQASSTARIYFLLIFNIFPLKPRVGQIIAIHAISTARFFFFWFLMCFFFLLKPWVGQIIAVHPSSTARFSPHFLTLSVHSTSLFFSPKYSLHFFLAWARGVKQAILLVTTSYWCRFPCLVPAEYKQAQKHGLSCIITVNQTYILVTL